MNQPYVRRGTRVDVQPPPWESEGGSGYMFSVDGHEARLQALCDRVINEPSGGKLAYRPASTSILLSVQRIQGFHSIAVAADEAIRYTYLEAAFWVRVKDATGEPAYLLPYVFHDGDVPTAVGRELYGFAKESAAVSMAPDGAKFTVNALVWSGPGATASRQDVLIIERTSLAHATQQELAPQNLFVAANHRVLLESTSAAIETYKGIISMDYRLVFLRQFGAPQGDGCDVRQIVHAPIRLRAGATPPELLVDSNGYRLTLPPVASHPIADDLGVLLDPQDHGIGLQLVTRSNFSFTLGAATSVSA